MASIPRVSIANGVGFSTLSRASFPRRQEGTILPRTEHARKRGIGSVAIDPEGDVGDSSGTEREVGNAWTVGKEGVGPDPVGGREPTEEDPEGLGLGLGSGLGFWGRGWMDGCGYPSGSNPERTRGVSLSKDRGPGSEGGWRWGGGEIPSATRAPTTFLPSWSTSQPWSCSGAYSFGKRREKDGDETEERKRH